VTQHINLYNPLFVKKKKPFSALAMAQALGFIAVGLACMYFYATLRAYSAERLATQVRQQLELQRDQVARLAKGPTPTLSKALEAEVARLESEVKARRTSLQALSTGELGNTAGFSEFFAAFGRQAVSGVWLTAITIGDAGNDLKVQGRTLRAELMPAFLRALSNEPIMRGRKVTEMKLTARAAPPAEKGAEGKPLATEPRAFIEFSLSAPLQMAEAAPAAAAGTP
jgi:Tfp pilus assembly protein PilN